jgi:hypothetical protein
LTLTATWDSSPQTDEMSAVKYLTINAALAMREGMTEDEEAA